MSTMQQENNTTGLEVAVIGMAGSFSGAKNIEEFWNNLTQGVESILHFTDKELEEHGIPPHLLTHPNYIKSGFGIEDVEYFDAAFFDCNPLDAKIMDPQIRLFLERTWEALENAAYNPECSQEPIGIYAGASPNRAWENLVLTSGVAEILGGFAAELYTDKDFLSSHISYKLNLQGPSITVFTACSTSLVAIHLACQGLLNGECGMAIAGASMAVHPTKQGYLYEEGMMVSPDGHCRSFDAKGQGTVFGTGGGVVVLKLLEDAIADGDHIYAVIKGSAINNDGNRKSGYTAPSVQGQAVAIKTAQHLAEVKPESVTYVEAHGTGTALGDPIEIQALMSAFDTKKKNFCRIGSLKPNIGHTYTSAGVAGFIKAALALKHRLIPPSINFETPNPQIDFDNSPFVVNTKLSEWKSNSYPLRAGVSSFAIGGTNAHVILEEAPVRPTSSEGREWKMILLSAKTETALKTMSGNLAEYLKKNPQVNLADVAYTLQVGRAHFPHRRRLICSTVEEAITALCKEKEEQATERIPGYMHTFLEDSEQSTIFMFAGQGAQYVRMGFDIYREEPIFREEIDRCAQILQPVLGYDVRTILYPDSSQKEYSEKQIMQTALTQPLIFMFEYALAKLLMQWGIRPYAMIGYSFGEYVAACLSGVFSLEDALLLIARRGKLMEQLPPGAMLSVPLSEEEVKPLLTEGLSLAIVNGPSCIVAGSEEAIMAFEQTMKEKHYMCMRLTVSLAAHSAEMDEIVEDLEKHFRSVPLHPPKIPYISTITGDWITPEQATDPHYWANHMKDTVRFADGVERLSRETDEAIFLEIGPGRDLSILVSRFIRENARERIMNTVRHPQKDVSDMYFLLDRIARLWGAGLHLNWKNFYAHETRYRLPLPTYPFERQRYCLADEFSKRADTAVGPLTPSQISKKKDIANWFYVPSWKRQPLCQSEWPQKQTCWLVFIDECGIGAQLVNRLQAEGHNSIIVRHGAEYLKMSDSEYVLNPRQKQDYEVLIQELLSMKRFPQNIVHLWGISQEDRSYSEFMDSAANDSLSLLPHDLNLTFYSLIYLAQIIGEFKNPEERRMIVITNNMQNIAGEGRFCPEKAMVLGPCKVIPQEYPYIRCHSIDILLPQKETWQEKKLLNQLFMELGTKVSGAKSSDQVIAFRDNHRWVQTVEPVTFEKPAAISLRLKEEGVYLITGGLGGIGLVLANYLARRVKAKLILVDCAEFPDKQEREQWLTTHDEHDSMSQQIRKVRELEELGSQVLVLRADVSHYEQMQNIVTQIEKQFGRINGIIHAAGVLDSGMIQLKTREHAESILAPKVLGTLVIDKILKDQDLDFLVLCSSLHPILGGLGLVVSTSADAFLDAFALDKACKDSVHTVSINWDLWQEVGMGLKAKEQGNDISFENAILPKEAIETFSRVLENTAPQVIISPQNIPHMAEQALKSTISDMIEETAADESPSSNMKALRPELSNPYIAPQNETEQAIVDIWQDFLGFQQLGCEDDFFDLGGDSLKAINLILHIKKKFKSTTISLQNFFERPTVKGIAACIADG